MKRKIEMVCVSMIARGIGPKVMCVGDRLIVLDSCYSPS